jgi:hemerythrin superfamily protein
MTLEETAMAQEEKSQDAVALLKSDHRTVEALFDKYKKARSAQQKADIAKQVCTELTIHTHLEEEIFYPACMDHVPAEMLDEAQVEHDGAKLLIAELLSGSPGDDFYDAKVTVLSEVIKHHVREEEKRAEGIFAKARDGGVDMDALAEQMRTRKQELTAEAEAGKLKPAKLRSFTGGAKTNGANSESATREKTSAEAEKEMTVRQERMPVRDEQGRFISEDERYSRQGRGRYRDDDDDDNDRRYRRGGRRMPERDEEGRFVSDEESRYGRSSRYREDDDDDRRYSARSRGGRRMPERDEEGRFVSDEEDYSSRHGRSGREERYSGSRSYSGRERDDDDRRYARDRGQGGWFGDPEGHSQAARRGWDERQSSYSRRRYDDDDDDDRRYSSRSRSRSRDDGEDDRRGWFGDPEGHAEAARRGWDRRR